MTPVNMKPLAGTRKAIFAADQPEYMPLPALVCPDRERSVVTEWVLTPEERASLLAGGAIRVRTWTFGAQFQPVQIVVVPEDERLELETVS